MSLEDLVKDGIKNIPAYIPGDTAESVEKKYGIAPEDILKLASNENQFGPSPKAIEAMAKEVGRVHIYPDPFCIEIRKKIGVMNGFDDSGDNVVIAVGASGILSLLGEVFIKKGDEVIFCEPTFGAYAGAVIRNDGTPVVLPLTEDLKFDLKAMYNAITDKTKMICICNPNNPTSSAILRSDMERLLTFCEQHDIFVMIDETYVEFAPVIEDVTAVPFTKTFKNLMVLRGVSKFFAAPGVRLGYGITGNMPFLKAMKEKQIPWSLNSLGAFAGELMLKDEEYIRQTRRLILSEREKMYSALKEQPAYKTYKPYANFLLVKLLQKETTAFDVFTHCVKNGLMIRDCSSFKSLDGEFIRFCVMDSKDNQRLLDELSFLCRQK